MRISLRSLCLTAVVLCALAPAARTQDYPNRPIRLLTGGTGGGSDMVARLMTDGLTTQLRQPVILDARPSGVLIAEIGSKAAPDGHTLVVYSAALWLLPLMQDKRTYDIFRDFAPITLVGTSPMVLVVHPAFPAKSVQELIALAKAKPRELNYASGPVGATPHVAGELFKFLAGVDIVHVPYRTVSAGLTDLIGGRVQLMFPVVGSAMPHVKAGKLRALGIGSLKPSNLAPGLTPVADAGLPGFEATATFGMFAPAKTPQVLIRRLNEEAVRVLSSPDVKEKLFGASIEVVGSEPDGLSKQMKNDVLVLGKVIRAAKIRLD